LGRHLVKADTIEISGLVRSMIGVVSLHDLQKLDSSDFKNLTCRYRPMDRSDRIEHPTQGLAIDITCIDAEANNTIKKCDQ